MVVEILILSVTLSRSRSHSLVLSLPSCVSPSLLPKPAARPAFCSLWRRSPSRADPPSTATGGADSSTCSPPARSHGFSPPPLVPIHCRLRREGSDLATSFSPAPIPSSLTRVRHRRRREGPDPAVSTVVAVSLLLPPLHVRAVRRPCRLLLPRLCRRPLRLLHRLCLSWTSTG